MTLLHVLYSCMKYQVLKVSGFYADSVVFSLFVQIIVLN